MEISNGEPGCQYYEQLCYNDMWLKVGDCVYIRSHGLVRNRVGRLVAVFIFAVLSCFNKCLLIYQLVCVEIELKRCGCEMERPTFSVLFSFTLRRPNMNQPRCSTRKKFSSATWRNPAP